MQSFFFLEEVFVKRNYCIAICNVFFSPCDSHLSFFSIFWYYSKHWQLLWLCYHKDLIMLPYVYVYIYVLFGFFLNEQRTDVDTEFIAGQWFISVSLCLSLSLSLCLCLSVSLSLSILCKEEIKLLVECKCK